LLFRLALAAALLASTFSAGVGQAADPPPVDARAGGLAGHLLGLADMDRGLCSILECQDPLLPVAVARSTEMLVHVQCSDPAAIARIRARLDKEGLYGNRVVAEVGTPSRLPFADNSVDLVLCASLDKAALANASVEKVVRVLRPRGVGVLGVPAGGSLTAARIRRWGDTATATQEIIEDQSGLWTRLVKKDLPLTDEWTHWQHLPDNNPVSTDAVIKAPYMTQFLALPYYSPMPSISVICNGIQFRAAGHMAIHVREEPLVNTLYATSTHNGTLLWTRPLPEGYLVHRSLFVAQPDTLYLLEPKRCVLLDPRTGAERGAIPLPPGVEDDAQWQWIALEDGVLYALIGKDAVPAEIIRRKRPVGAWGWNELSAGYYTSQYPWGYGRTLIALEPKTARELWRHEEKRPIDSRALCMKGGKVFIHGEGSYVAALDAKTGAVVWRNEDPALLAAIAEGNDQGLGFKTTPYALCTEDMLFFAGRGRKNVVGVRAGDGAHLWTVPGGYNATNLLYSSGYLYAHIPSATKIDPLTGALAGDLGIQKRSCARFTGCPEALFHRGSVQVGEGTTRYDLSAGRPGVIHAFRPPCNDGIIPAEGLLHITQWDCDCNLQLMGGIALAPAGGFDFGQQATDAERLETLSPPRGTTAPFAAAEGDWPTYRADNARSSGSRAAVPRTAQVRWQYEPSQSFRPTAPTAAGGLVFIGGDDCRVRAIDAATGKERWRFATAGPVRIPPSVWEGRAYLGSADGYIYCVQAATGQPLWRFRAAPAERRIMVFGRLSSTWPVNTGVLVQDGVAYAGAGIISYDGTYVYALDAQTGRLRWQNDTSGHLNPELRAGASVQGDMALLAGRLMMAGGNVACPALYELADGKCLNAPPGLHPPGAHRGSEVCAFLDRYVMVGGQRLFTDPNDPISTNQGVAFQGAGVAPNKGLPGRVPPAFGSGAAVMAAGGPLVCADAGEVEKWLKIDDKNARITQRWTAQSVQGAVATAIAANAVVAAGRRPAGEEQTPVWLVAALDLQTGKELWSQPLPEPPLPGGLCLDARGRTLVVLESGKVVCLA